MPEAEGGQDEQQARPDERKHRDEDDPLSVIQSV